MTKLVDIVLYLPHYDGLDNLLQQQNLTSGVLYFNHSFSYKNL